MLRLVRAAALAAFTVASLAASFGISSALAQSLIVEKKTFTLPSYTTAGGSTIKNVKIGWEAAGTLNADKSNAILITHFFSGTSHAFGKYAESDKVPGYWDYMVGPGKIIDTDKYYVLSSDTLVNLNANAPNVVTTGPASINPDTGKPYGMSFPVVSMKDFVAVQHALIESLGIKKLKAVMGASMGALQAYQWGASYPDGWSARRGGRRAAWRRLPHRLARRLGGADQARSEVEPRRLLRQGAADRGAQSRAQAHYLTGAAVGMGGKSLRSGPPIRPRIRPPPWATSSRSRRLWRRSPRRARRPPTPIRCSIWSRPTSSPMSIRLRSRRRCWCSTRRPTSSSTRRGSRRKTKERHAETGQLPGPNGHINGVIAVAKDGDKIKAFLAK